jgi:hypothetical protein
MQSPKAQIKKKRLLPSVRATVTGEPSIALKYNNNNNNNNNKAILEKYTNGNGILQITMQR